MTGCLIIQASQSSNLVSIYLNDWHGTVCIAKYGILELTNMVGSMVQPIKDGLDSLVDMFKDSDSRVRHAAVTAFGHLGQRGK
jgi:hypothetical protein